MTLLVISPDYASHLLPLATLATAWHDAGERVVVATGPATDHIVRSFGFTRVDLRLGRGSNPGVIRAEQQPAGEDDALRGFFAATAAGMVATLQFQADARRSDLLWQPLDTARAVLRVLDAVRPDEILVDHLAFTARLALTASGTRYADVVLGHPTALVVPGELYGYPTAWPATLRPDVVALEALRKRSVEVREQFTDDWNQALRVLDPAAAAVDDAFAISGPDLLLNYPDRLHDPARTALLPRHTFLGSAVRDETADAETAAWLDQADPRPIVYVSFGSFLSARGDVLARVVAALRPLDVRVALTTGSSDTATLGTVPAHWLVREHLPQVAVLDRAALAVTHGGNNSVTEALNRGVPLLVMPFSTDQFAAAAAVERAGLGMALDPNAATVQALRAAATAVMHSDMAAAAQRIGVELRARPGRDVARTALVGR
ncbi:glycosyltransferase family 1 protein [Dactylosporangium aurantiacum]|uniref:Glycosyltransferase family 1 protein n=1 Tax=Dactylosporangium aurantiacum TaxID=35754 RepID=A0A9Q9ITS3_9ACTN|nr:glycosyltransferase [Dactylosporangium aurantiacum]MDG6103996.1 glycosyltransferase [Dactylosporangium aurantiacum]UWZ58828.1 glycosyltransferase family 1 protein [Dactylosporangium aurantiacum]